MDLRKAVALTLLDLSTAFDTNDHAILNDCLKEWIERDCVKELAWIDTYLDNRKQKSNLEDKFSEAFQLPFGFPQGSVQGPFFLLFILLPLVPIVQEYPKL